jgi:hypothetical protein
MSILIKKMEMPKTCALCPFREIRYKSGYYNYEHCSALNMIFNENKLDIDPYKERLSDCPLIEIADTEWEWCHDCKEYDQEKHCCHRWSKVIRQTVEEVKESYKIVTCGECIHRHEHKWYNTCDKHIGHGFEDDYFCKYGERRSDEGTNE